MFLVKNIRAPLVTIPRLSLYYRVLIDYSDSGLSLISSYRIAQLAGFTDAQVRKDLAYFGQFGAPGKGYQVDVLKKAIIKILGTDKQWPVVLIGAGNLGSALLSYKGFSKHGFKIVAAFDADSRKIGKSMGGVMVRDISQLEKEIKLKEVAMAIITAPQDVAPELVDRLIKAGIKAILNFAPIRLRAPEGVEILNIDLSIELERLAYFLTHHT